MKALRPRERLFVEAYLANRGNGTESARRCRLPRQRQGASLDNSRRMN